MIDRKKLEELVESGTSTSINFIMFIDKIREKNHAVDDQTPLNKILSSQKSSLQHYQENMRPCYDQHSQEPPPISFCQSFIII